ncbi:hypothetical protein ABI_45670 [Asticcacaulis biprosthecium C19]|uniref:Heparan-alpha-glucosaminide N-acetyltransferase catalytic domain-containing protein n=1 Tax=Asticcacaulis biprosthecium C19 TaxID=715226 RepID=F4QTS0_9CAUL|nr:heparan-alpha-glucosaminide N-acetyltransferase domain-containing protein [Asticcacaulis biprosthecium]EGF89220.1 hypothetical protein ABI_45670 [Asticcacaulis biprosthecium C19]
MAEVIAFKKREKPKEEEPAPPKPASVRFEALDILRGLFIIGMLLANNAGDWSHIYTPLDHAEWHGFTLTDMVFPGFMTCVGLSMTLSLGRRQKTLNSQAGGKAALLVHSLRRAAILVGIGLFLNLLPQFDFEHWRLPGVLQRIGICYAIASGLVVLHSHQNQQGGLILHSRALALWGVGFLVAYTLLLKYVPVPDGAGANQWDAIHSWPAWVDMQVLGVNHVWSGAKTYDPEGLLSSVPATSNILFGILMGLYINTRTPRNAWGGVAIIGVLLMLLALVLDSYVPIIKKLWTPSFVLLSCGFAFTVLAVLMVVMDRLGFKRWAVPIKLFGTNAILVYVFAWLLSIALGMTGGTGAATTWILAQVGDPYLMSFLYAFGALVICGLFLVPFYIKRWFLKI